MTFAPEVPTLFTSFVYRHKKKTTFISGMNWYYFVAIAILHQPCPTDSADINTRLQLSDTSSIQPMHGGFLLVADISGSSWLLLFYSV